NVKMQKMSIFFICFLLSLLSSITHSRTYYDEDMVSNIIARGYRPYAASNRFPVEPRRAIRSDYQPTPCRWKLCASLFSRR
uniref:Uncharacterized protein n=1 Tax=Parascaris univalens TaxID=6257 RepID=A0A915A4K2_PARUN